MELAILILKEELLQQKEQLNRIESRKSKSQEKIKEFKEKAVSNIKGFIAELESAINKLNKPSRTNEQLSMPDVVQQRELLMAYNRWLNKEFAPSGLKLVVKDADDFLQSRK